MKILVDADACPVVRNIEEIAEQYNIPVCLFCDTNHVLTSSYSEVKIIGAGADAVDFALVNQCQKGDLVVTQDYGVAAMALGKGAYGIHQSGKWYTDENIDRMLMERHMAKKARMGKRKHHLKGFAKRTEQDNRIFEESFTNLVRKILCEEGHMRAVIRSSICTGEKVAGFKNLHTGKFEDMMLIKTEKDVESFQKKYGVHTIVKEY
ncbi:MAG: YaiI/YqxD family protein [Lachnospiraceae bacterium]|nr:YaiI/YqxD family protein [Lachnospiraceae bacterium]